MPLVVVIILGIVEGLTEFLPVSSTGHLLLVSHFFGYSDEKADTFDIFIQLGAVLAVLWEYRTPLTNLAARAPRDVSARSFFAKLFLAFLPAAAVGYLFHEKIEQALFHQVPIAIALIVGGVLMFAVEMFRRPAPSEPVGVESITWAQAFGVGLFQILGLWPGISRSGATIVGGLAIGLDRPAATTFSFYLALPTLGAATLYKLYKSRHLLTSDDVLPFGLGLVVSFVVALLAIRGLLRYVRHHDFRPFAVYRIALGTLVLLLPAKAE